MSRVTELAEAEAARAEAEDAKPRPGPEPEHKPEPELEPPKEGGDKAAKAMDGHITRYVTRVAEIMGEDFALVFPCAACAEGIPGFVFTAPSAEPDYLEDPDTMTCPRCAGWTKLRSGAKDEVNRLKACSQCAGTGYVQRPATQPNYGYPPPPTGSVSYVPAASALDNRDQWGRAQGHPQWGVDPDTIGR